MLKAIVRYSMRDNKRVAKWTSRFVFCLSTLQASIPGIFRLVSGKGGGYAFGTSPIAKVVTSMCFVMTWMFMFPLATFLVLGIVDQLRQVWCGVVWCGVVWCGVVWCGVVWCGVVWCGVVW
jgi:hypothetical protein